jgi:predicted TIM-barrel fold metal-dependent hydrolase
LKPDHSVTRRTLLAGTLTSAACGLARNATHAQAETTSTLRDAPIPITDTHVYLSRWPHARLPGDEPKELVAQLKMAGVTQAFAGTFDGLFHKDIASANERLAHTCAEHGQDLLLPFGSVNPTLPAWEGDIHRCRESFHMRGIRLHPTYHSYKLDDPRFAKVLPLATDAELVVQIVVSLNDKQHRWLNPQNDPLDLAPLSKVVSRHPKLRLLVSGAQSSALKSEGAHIAEFPQAYIEINASSPFSEWPPVLGSISADRLTVGSGAPLHDAPSIHHLMASFQMTARDRQFIANGSAKRLIAGDH